MDLNVRDFPDSLRTKLGIVSEAQGVHIRELVIQMVEAGIALVCMKDKDLRRLLTSIEEIREGN